MKILALIRGKRRGVGGSSDERGAAGNSSNSTKKFPFVGKFLRKKSASATTTASATAPKAQSSLAAGWPADEAVLDFYADSDEAAEFYDLDENEDGGAPARGGHGSMRAASQGYTNFSGRLEPDSRYPGFQSRGSGADTPPGLKSDSGRLSFSGSLEPEAGLDTAGHTIEFSKFGSQNLSFGEYLDPDSLSAATEAPGSHFSRRHLRRLSVSGQLGPDLDGDLDYSGSGDGKKFTGSRFNELLVPEQHAAAITGSGRESATANLSSRRLSYHEQLQELEPAAAELAVISRKGGTGSLSSRQLRHGAGVPKQDKGAQIGTGGLLARSFRRLSVSFRNPSQLREREQEQKTEGEQDSDNFIECEAERNSNAERKSRQWSFKRQAPKKDQEQERQVEHSPDEVLEREAGISLNAKGTSRRRSFRSQAPRNDQEQEREAEHGLDEFLGGEKAEEEGTSLHAKETSHRGSRRWSIKRQAPQNDQEQEREAEHDSDKFFEGERGRSLNAKGTSRRWSFRRHALQKDQNEQSQHHEYDFSGPLMTSGNATVKEGTALSGSSRRLSFGGGTSLKEDGARIGSSRRFSFRGSDDLDRKGHTQGHSQVIAMWNPASNSATTIEASQGNSGQLWLKQASKRWREFGSGRRSADVDPIEMGPERLQDWRVRILGIDPVERWPVQGW